MKYNARMTKEQAQEIYKDLGYLSQPFPYACAAYLEAYSRLLGLSPAPAKSARVLEIGSAYGGNILSQAMFYPEATFTGLEIAPTQVSVGNTYIAQLGLTNIQLLESDINESQPHLGTYDYIIAHGFYSWVDDDTKDSFLKLCQAHLAPHGILYISYNTYPGWHTMDAVRGLLLFANKQVDGLNHRERVHLGKTMGAKLGTYLLEPEALKNYHTKLLGALGSTLRKHDSYVGHDHLEPVNTPVYFHQFIDHMKSHGFQYVCDADLSLSFPTVYDEKLRTHLQELAPHEPLEQEQYIDFIQDTSFRKSILTHKGSPIPRLKETSHLDASFHSHLEELLLTNFIEKSQWDAIVEAKVSSIPEEEQEAMTHVCQQILSEGPHFYLQNHTVVTKNNTHVISESIQPTFYALLLDHIVRGGIQCTPLEKEHPFHHHVYQENESYIPERYVPFVEIMLQEGINSFIYPGNRYNAPISDFNEEDLEFMKLLTKPTSALSVLLRIFEAMTGESTTEEALYASTQYTMILAFYEEMIRRMESFGFFER